MVGRLLLLKLLHLKRLRKRQNRDTDSDGDPEFSNNCSNENTSVFNVKVENGAETIEHQNMTCRVCLKEGHIPIFGDLLTEDYAEAMSTFTNLEIARDDDFPKFLCTVCQSLLQGAMHLRKTAQESDQLLRKPKKEIVVEDNEDIISFDYEDNDYEVEDQIVKSSKTFHCDVCDIDCKSAKDLNFHRRTIGHHNKKYHCPICKKSYGLAYYKNHMAYHKTESPFMCDVCGKSFKLQSLFRRHRIIHNINFDLPYTCHLCPYKGRFSESLKMHMRKHTGERPYQCSECPFRSINKSNLNRHMTTHTKEHKFRCDSCGKGFFTKRDLGLHLKVDHAGIKDHVCNICGKAFGYRKQMMKHQLKVHKREKLQNGRMPLYLQQERKKQLEQAICK